MATVKKGAVTSTNRSTRPVVKTIREVLNEEDQGEKPVAYLSRTGADAAWVIPSRPKHAANGDYIGMDEGVHMDFRGVGVTRPFFMSNPVDRALTERIDEFIETNHPIIHELGLEKLKPEQPRPPFRKWDTLSGAAIKVTLSSLLSDDHDDNVRLLKECARYELACPEPRDDVIGILDGLMVGEAHESDAFNAEVSIA